MSPQPINADLMADGEPCRRLCICNMLKIHSPRWKRLTFF